MQSAVQQGTAEAVVPDRSLVEVQVDAVMAWVRAHHVSWLGLNIHDGQLTVTLHQEPGGGLVDRVPWESRFDGGLPEAGSPFADRSVYGRAFGGVVVSVLTWRPADLDVERPVETVAVAGGVL